MMLAPVHAYTAEHQATLASNASIHFIALPYLHVFHASGHEQTIIIALSNRSIPLRLVDLVQQPIWTRMNIIEHSSLVWHAPALTPKALALAVAEQQRKARLAKRMADRAFYFGYDTNNDALK